MTSRILVLVIASDSPAHYVEMQAVWRESVKRQCVNRFDIWFVKAKPERLWIGDIVNDGPLSDIVEFDREAMTIFVKGEETYIPGILNKTIEAIRACHLTADIRACHLTADMGALGGLFDYIWRTNLSSVLDFQGLLDYVDSSSLRSCGESRCSYDGESLRSYDGESLRSYDGESLRSYDGESLRSCGESRCSYDGESLRSYDGESLRSYDGESLRSYDGESLRSYDGESLRSYAGYIGTSVDGYNFASGAGFLMSQNVVDYLIDNERLLMRDVIDDVAIGKLLEPRFGLVHIDRCWVDGSLINCSSNIFHFRCETYKHERTIEFMNCALNYICERRSK